MTAPADWARAADPARRIGWGVEFHAAIGSTNDRARAALAEDGREGLAIVADLQTAGRGRRGRSWLSPAGANLAVSVAMRPRLHPARAGLLGMAAALAALDACRAAVPGAAIGLRWPNDLVTAGEQLKVAGLLVETTLVGDDLGEAVIGIGINVNWPRAEMPPELRERATSLADLAGAALDRVALLGTLLDRLDREVADLEAGDSPVPRLREASTLTGRWVVVDLGASTLDGRVAGIADDGALELDAGGRVLQLSVGEVVSVRDVTAGAAA